MLDFQHDLPGEVRHSRKDLMGHLGERFEKLEGKVAEMRTALKAKGIIYITAPLFGTPLDSWNQSPDATILDTTILCQK